MGVTFLSGLFTKQSLTFDGVVHRGSLIGSFIKEVHEKGFPLSPENAKITKNIYQNRKCISPKKYPNNTKSIYK